LIDLGANCGNSYHELEKKYGPFNKSYLWEINPFLFPTLEKLASENEGVTFVPYGAWNEETEITIDVYGRPLT